MPDDSTPPLCRTVLQMRDQPYPKSGCALHGSVLSNRCYPRLQLWNRCILPDGAIGIVEGIYHHADHDCGIRIIGAREGTVDYFDYPLSELSRYPPRTPDPSPMQQESPASHTDNTTLCDGAKLRLLDGSFLDLEHPDPKQLTPRVLFTGLSNICRYGGQLPQFYSVAEHCCHCYDVYRAIWPRTPYTTWDPEILLHDAHEAITGDMPRPTKLLVKDFAAFEKRISDAVAVAFSLDWDAAAAVIHEVDNAVTKQEMLQLWGSGFEQLQGFDEVPDIPVTLKFWPPEVALCQLLLRFKG